MLAIATLIFSIKGAKMIALKKEICSKGGDLLYSKTIEKLLKNDCYSPRGAVENS